MSFVFPDERRVELHHRDGGDTQRSRTLDPDGAREIALPAIDVSLAWDHVCAKLELLGCARPEALVARGEVRL